LDGRAIVVLDCGKTLAKLSLWRRDGTLLAREVRPNDRVDAGPYRALDTDGIAAWLETTLRQFASVAEIGAIIPVGHGAGLAIVRDGRLACPPPDYEDPVPWEMRRTYDTLRDSFALTGSPPLPDGLNLGVQLFRLEALHPRLLGGGEIVMPWAQYWAWLLSGVAASEITSLGCHTDLWLPAKGRPSGLAVASGWAQRLAPLHGAGEVLGPITADWAARTGLPADVVVHCGLHDSNAALLAARAFPEISDNESTVLSTGTWFVAMRSPRSEEVEIARLSEHRDCLVNVDAFDKPIPSARFMGGREIETLIGLDTRRIDIKLDQPALLAALPAVIERGVMVLPSFAPGVGPFPHARGRWIDMPHDAAERRAAVSLYVALVADVALDLIGAREHILVEGRFAEAEAFVRALATLRPDDTTYVSNAHNDVSFGALRLLVPDLEPQSRLVEVAPLDLDLTAYRETWRREAERMEQAA
jgi:sugar (pentulose or hexulose) kinase